MKKFLATILIMAISIYGAAAFAEVQTFEGVGVHYIESDKETLGESQEKAKQDAMLNVLEQAQFFIRSYTEMHNFNLTQDEIIAVTAAVISFNGVKYSIKEELGVLVVGAEITAQIDTDRIPELIELELQKRKEGQ